MRTLFTLGLFLAVLVHLHGSDRRFFVGGFGTSEKNWFFAILNEESGRYIIHYWAETLQESDYYDWVKWEGVFERGPVFLASPTEVLGGGPMTAYGGYFNHWSSETWGHAFLDHSSMTLYLYAYDHRIYLNGADSVKVALKPDAAGFRGGGKTGLGNDFTVSVAPDRIDLVIQVGSVPMVYTYDHKLHPRPAGSFFDQWESGISVDDRSWPWIRFQDNGLWGWCVGATASNFYFYGIPDLGWCWTSQLYWPWIYRYQTLEWEKLPIVD